jgi:hypothetical protein
MRLNRISKRAHALRTLHAHDIDQAHGGSPYQRLRSWNRTDIDIFAIDNPAERAYLAWYL